MKITHVGAPPIEMRELRQHEKETVERCKAETIVEAEFEGESVACETKEAPAKEHKLSYPPERDEKIGLFGKIFLWACGIVVFISFVVSFFVELFGENGPILMIVIFFVGIFLVMANEHLKKG